MDGVRFSILHSLQTAAHIFCTKPNAASYEEMLINYIQKAYTNADADSNADKMCNFSTVLPYEAKHFSKRKLIGFGFLIIW